MKSKDKWASVCLILSTAFGIGAIVSYLNPINIKIMDYPVPTGGTTASLFLSIFILFTGLAILFALAGIYMYTRKK